MYVVCVTFEVKPHARVAFLELARTQARNSLERELECHCFDVCVSDDGAQVFLYEHYTDAAAFDGHLKTPHFLDFDAVTRDLVAEKTVKTYRLAV